MTGHEGRGPYPILTVTYKDGQFSTHRATVAEVTDTLLILNDGQYPDARLFFPLENVRFWQVQP